MYYGGFAILARRNRMLSLFRRAGATSAENAVSIQEIVDTWPLRGIKRLRNRMVTLDVNFLCRRKRLVRTRDERYYLVERR